MNDDRWNELLAELKKAAMIQDVLPIVSDPAAQKLLLAWPRTCLRYEEPPGAPPEDENGQWRWLWLGVAWDENELAAISALQPFVLRIKLDQMKGNRLIFPDGSVSQYAERYLKATAATAINEAIAAQTASLKRPGGDSKDTV